MAQARDYVAKHPWLVAGGALALGALWGFGRPRGRISGAIAGVIGAVAVGVVRDLAIKRVAGYARHWIDQSERRRADIVTSRNRATEDAILEH